MARLTRAESQDRTRRLIVASAEKLFLRDGFRATSLEQIAEDAGFTRGAVYSNFANKTEMGVAVVDALYQREEQRVIDAVDGVIDQGPEAWLVALSGWAQSTLGDPEWARLEIEISTFAYDDGDLRAATAARHARLRKRTAEMLTDACTQAGIAPPREIDTISLALISLALGLGIQRASDPSIPGAAFGDLLRLIFGATLVPG